MITLTIVEQVKNKNGVKVFKRKIKVYNSMDKASKEIKPIVSEMKRAEKAKVNPEIKIEAVSYDFNSEKQLLLDLHAIESIENEEK